jgi:hypothetical protein
MSIAGNDLRTFYVRDPHQVFYFSGINPPKGDHRLVMLKDNVERLHFYQEDLYCIKFMSIIVYHPKVDKIETWDMPFPIKQMQCLPNERFVATDPLGRVCVLIRIGERSIVLEKWISVVESLSLSFAKFVTDFEVVENTFIVLLYSTENVSIAALETGKQIRNFYHNSFRNPHSIQCLFDKDIYVLGSCAVHIFTWKGTLIETFSVESADRGKLSFVDGQLYFSLIHSSLQRIDTFRSC